MKTGKSFQLIRPPCILQLLLLLAVMFIMQGCEIPNPFAIGDWFTGKNHWPQTSPGFGRVELRDQYGRAVIYHGLAIANSSKTRFAQRNLPWHTQADLSRMRTQWGFNAVRLLVFWMAIEPTEGNFDTVYLQGISDFVGMCEAEGLDVIIDFHKDVYGRAFDNNGFPAWATETDGIAYNPPPGMKWYDGYLQPAVLRAFYNFWNSNYLKGRYLRMARELLVKLRDDGRTIAGVEPMNEPFPHRMVVPSENTLAAAMDIVENIEIAQEFETVYLSPFYQSFAAMMESEGLTCRMFFEPWIATSAGIPTSLSYQARPQDVYTPHFYYRLNGAEEPTTGYPGLFGKRYVEVAAAQKADEAKDFGIPLLFSEFGIDDRWDGALSQLKDFLDVLDYHGAGWLYHCYDPISASAYGVLNDDFTERTTTLDVLDRPYPMRIAGNYPRFACEDNRFMLSYVKRTSTAPTEIWVPLRITSFRIYVNGQERLDLVRGPDNVIDYWNDNPAALQEIIISWD